MAACSATHPFIPTLRRVSRASAARIAIVVATSLLAGAPLTHGLTNDQTGKWSPNSNWHPDGSNKYAIHLVLLRGEDSPYHSRILWWNSDVGGVFYGGEWGWKTGSDGCDSFPQASSFIPVSVPSSG